LISVAGTWMQIVAQGWLVYQISHSELTLGLVGFASAIPALLISPWGGVVVDRVPKRSLLVVTQSTAMLLAFILAALSFSGAVQVWHVVLLAAGLGVVNAFDGPGRQAFVVEMVGRQDLTNAIALNSMMFNGARVIGPAIGGFLLATVGGSWCFFINGLSFLAVIVGLLAMKLPRQRTLIGGDSPRRQLIGGLRYVWANTHLFALLMLALIFSVFGISYSTLLPAFADQVLHVGAVGYGAINAATGFGAVTGALFMARYGDKGRRGVWLVWANLAFPVLLFMFAHVSQLPVALILAYGLGVGFMLQFTIINTLLQTQVADAMRGRVLSLYTLTFFGFAPFGNLAMGTLAEGWGLSMTIGLSAALSLILALAVIALVPRLRGLR
jgi:MFS family permease